ncbi:hypothetical protein PybrP1_010753 [[Pythium] brassicae (nom. inval.)]|nr:hypothetical protein PybrP1_010753 [[Pythium] brassicae (nom. inval.)]
MDDELLDTPTSACSDPSSVGVENVENAGARRSDAGAGGAGGGGGGGVLLPSFIWDYFVKEPGRKSVVCTLCTDRTTRFAYSGGTSTMNRHLRKKHQKFAPGKSAADYRTVSGNSSKRDDRGGGDGDGASVTTHADAAAASPKALDTRGTRRRATPKRRKLALLDADAAGAAGAQEFDPSGFVGLASHAGVSPGPGLHFPPGFELGDSVVDMGGDQRFFDYTTLTGGAAALGLGAGLAFGRSHRRHSGSSAAAAAAAATHKVLTHRLLKYLIAQYEPLDVSRMGAELSVLLYGSEYQYALPPRARLPGEEALKRALANLYYSQRELLKEVVAEVEVLSLSLHNWTSVFGQNVLTVSGHWVSNGFGRRDCVLEVYVLPLDERVNTIALLRDVLDKWDIPAAKVAALTMLPDGKEAAILDEYPGLLVVSCFVRVLDGAVAAGLLKCAPLLRRCRNYVSYFIQNPSEYQIFLALQRRVAEAAAGFTGPVESADNDNVDNDNNADNVVDDNDNDDSKASGAAGPSSSSSSAAGGATMLAPALSVICDVEGRWNSTSEMICRIVELEQLLLLYKSGLESDTNPTRRPMQLRFVCCELSADEWANLKELARLLEPIEGVVHVAPSLEYPGLSLVHPLLHSIKKHVDDAERWVATPLVAAVRTAIASGLSLPLCAASSAAPPSSPYLSSLLDPRFKSLAFVPPDERARVVATLELLHSELLGDATLPSPADRKKSGGAAPTPPQALAATAPKKTAAVLLHEFFPLDEPPSELEKLQAQVQQYLASPSLPATDESASDPLEWWARYQRLFPSLAKLAKKHLCVSAVSLPFDEAFTNYGQLMKEKKARLDIEVAAQILFCRSVSRIPEMDRMNV